MIYIEIVYKDNNISSLKVSGHSYFDDKGQDIICAGVSAICQQLGHSLVRLTEFSGVIEGQEGIFKVVLTEKDLADKKIKLLLDSSVLGLKGIYNSYRGFIKIKEITEE
ncbi:MAG: ribosomal-processing cysteine protease Prp [Candidatus Hydrogenedentota bacterium]